MTTVLPPITVPLVDDKGKMTSAWYRYFFEKSLQNQPVELSSYIDLQEMTVPAAGVTNHARLFARDSGGKTQLAAIFPTGGSPTDSYGAMR